MSSPAEPFAAAEEQALRASHALAEAMGGRVRFYTEVPQGAALPYIVGGQHEIADESEGCGEAHSIVTTLRWFTKAVGTNTPARAARKIGAAIVAALQTELVIDGHETVLVVMEIPEGYRSEPDGSASGIVAFRYATTSLD